MVLSHHMIFLSVPTQELSPSALAGIETLLHARLDMKTTVGDSQGRNARRFSYIGTLRIARRKWNSLKLRAIGMMLCLSISNTCACILERSSHEPKRKFTSKAKKSAQSVPPVAPRISLHCSAASFHPQVDPPVTVTHAVPALSPLPSHIQLAATASPIIGTQHLDAGNLVKEQVLRVKIVTGRILEPIQCQGLMVLEPSLPCMSSQL